jgi:hypothetical protein
LGLLARKFTLIFMAAALVITGAGFASQPAQAEGISATLPDLSQAVVPLAPTAVRDADASTRITFQQRVDIFSGEGGVFMPGSNYLGFVAINRIHPDQLPRPGDLDFVQDGLEFRIFDDQGSQFRTALGLMYVYFNLNDHTRALFNDGRLAIHYFNPAINEWQLCRHPVFIGTTNLPQGRLSCVALNFGIYGLAETPPPPPPDVVVPPPPPAVPAVAAEADAFRRVDFQQRAEVFSGNGGVFLPSSNYLGFLTIDRPHPADLPQAPATLDFAQRGLDYRAFDNQGNRIPRVFGFNYVFFNLDSRTRTAFNQGDLAIYFFNPDANAWQPCQHPVFFGTTNPPHGRLACVATNFGLFSLMIAR